MKAAVRFWHYDEEPAPGLRHGRLGDVVEVESDQIAAANVMVSIDPLDGERLIVGPSFQEPEEWHEFFRIDVAVLSRMATLRAVVAARQAPTRVPTRWRSFTASEWWIVFLLAAMGAAMVMEGRW